MRGRTAIALVCVCALGVTSSSQAATLKGPDVVAPGKRAKWRVRGMPAYSTFKLQLQPTSYRGSNGAGYLTRREWRVRKNGARTFRFRWPRHYYVCVGASNCKKRQWSSGTRADVYTQGDAFSRLKVVSIR